MKCALIFCHSALEDQIRQVLDDSGCERYVGVSRAFARDGDERRLDSRFHPGADAVLMAFVDDHRVDPLIAAVQQATTREHTIHTRIVVLPIEKFV